MVVGQLVEQLLPASEIRGSIPVIDNLIKKRPGMAKSLQFDWSDVAY